MYYYFFKNQIKAVPYHINCDINKAYTAFTAEQISFIEANPTATAQEVINLQMYSAIQVQEPELNEVKSKALTYLSAYSSKTMGKFVSDLQLANAQTSIYLIGIETECATVYSLEKSTSTINKYNAIGKQCRDKYYELSAIIEQCANVAAVEDVIQSAEKFYDNLTYNE